MGWLYATTKSLWPSILAHVSYNASALVYFKVYEGIEENVWETNFLPPSVLLISAITMILGLSAIFKVTKVERET